MFNLYDVFKLNLSTLVTSDTTPAKNQNCFINSIVAYKDGHYLNFSIRSIETKEKQVAYKWYQFQQDKACSVGNFGSVKDKMIKSGMVPIMLTYKVQDGQENQFPYIDMPGSLSSTPKTISSLTTSRVSKIHGLRNTNEEEKYPSDNLDHSGRRNVNSPGYMKSNILGSKSSKPKKSSKKPGLFNKV